MPKDEKYIIDLCDQVLNAVALRQHKFSFLHGDPNKNGRCRLLPVDAFYPKLNLVIEYRERQHSEDVSFFDRRQTISGCSRAEQRKRYDQRRRDKLRENHVDLIESDYTMFPHRKGSKRLTREPTGDLEVVRRALGRFISEPG